MAEVAQLAKVIEALLGHLQAKEATGGGGGEKTFGDRDILSGKGFDVMDKFGGGEAEWNEWSGDFKTMVETRSDMAAEALAFVKQEGKNEKEVMTWDNVLRGLKDQEKYELDSEACIKRFEKLGNCRRKYTGG